MKPYKIASIVVTYNRCHLLTKTLASLVKQNVDTIYVIDNNSKDETYNVVSAWADKTKGRVRYVNTGANLGGAGGFALGCKLALESEEKFTHVWFSDDDVTFHHDCLEKLTPYLDKKTILQPMRYDIKGQNAEQSSTDVDLKSVWILNHKRNSIKDTHEKYNKEPFEIDFMPFEGPIVPIPVLKFTGLPDELYFIFSDDLDFALRARKLGFKIRCIPKAGMTRWVESGNSHDVASWKTYFNYRNFFRIQKLYGENRFVRNRPYLIACLVVAYCCVRFEFKKIRVILDALEDAMSYRFKYHEKYMPK
ncbi:glycosyltransferase [Vibrio sp.]|uniref:glycosyltransferase n=1 Tax=Vibrio sp. TaxID=678 RepID=UPI003AA88ACE